MFLFYVVTLLCSRWWHRKLCDGLTGCFLFSSAVVVLESHLSLWEKVNGAFLTAVNGTSWQRLSIMEFELYYWIEAGLHSATWSNLPRHCVPVLHEKNQYLHYFYFIQMFTCLHFSLCLPALSHQDNLFWVYCVVWLCLGALSPSLSVIYLLGEQRWKCTTTSTHDVIESYLLKSPLRESWCFLSFKHSLWQAHTLRALLAFKGKYPLPQSDFCSLLVY